MACRQHLLVLARRGDIVLPEARPTPWRVGREPAVMTALEMVQFNGGLPDLGGVDLQAVVGGTSASAQWNAPLHAHHPLGSGPLCGAQIRYLIVSRRLGAIGGLALSSAARGTRQLVGLER
jgi:hypothetical protein